MRAYIVTTGFFGKTGRFKSEPSKRADCLIIGVFTTMEIAHDYIIKKYLPNASGSWAEKYPNYWDGFGEYLKIEQWQIREGI